MTATCVEFGHDIVGPTTARPGNADPGQSFYDQTLGQWMTWNGTAWQPSLNGNMPFVSPNTAGNIVYTAAQMINGIIERDCNGAGRADTTDTAANIIAALGMVVGMAFETIVQNISGGAFSITLGGGTGVTIKGNNVIPQNKTAFLTVRMTGAGTLTIYSSVSA